MKYIFVVCLLCFVIAKGEIQFDYFTFSQDWPTSFCITEKAQKRECEVDKNVTTWTIHGLWPSTKYKTPDPEFCNKTATFNKTAIAGLKPQLHKYWPNMFPNTEPNQLWKHEYEKHGTCATSVSKVNNEYNYFFYTLYIRKWINIDAKLAKNGIKPRKEPYKLKEITSALDKAFNGFNVNLQCSSVHGKHYIKEIHVCLTKEFKQMDCKVTSLPFHRISSTTSCSKKHIYYPKKNNQTEVIKSKQMKFENIDNVPEIRQHL